MSLYLSALTSACRVWGRFSVGVLPLGLGLLRSGGFSRGLGWSAAGRLSQDRMTHDWVYVAFVASIWSGSLFLAAIRRDVLFCTSHSCGG